MTPLSPQTKSFVILSTLAVLGVFLCLMLWADLIYPASQTKQNLTQTKAEAPDPSAAIPAPQPVDTTDWLTYSNAELGISFKYKPDWKVLAPKKTQDGFTILQIDPGSKFYDIKIYFSPTQYYIMDALPSKTETIGGQPALN